MPRLTTPRPTTPRPTRPRPILAVLAAVLSALAVAGCVSMPTGGPVFSYPVTQGTAAQNEPNVQIQPKPPGANWTPQEIVEGFLSASASYGSYPQVVKQYLAPEEQSWNPSWSAVVYKTGPTPGKATYSPSAKNPTTVTVTINGTVQASLLGYGNYSLPSASAPGGSPAPPVSLTLQKVGGQWRISSVPSELLLTSNSFSNDYQLRNLYFFDPLTRVLVPDPVYVPILAGDLMDGLVNELNKRPGDWLSYGATHTAFPAKTKVSSVTLDGVTAVVNLTGTAIGKASSDNDAMQQIAAQLFWTLSNDTPTGSAGQGVQSVQIVVNGKVWAPGGQTNAVQRATVKWAPATGTGSRYYYVSSAGYLTSNSVGGSPVIITRLSTDYKQIAVSRDGTYLAAIRGTTLYTGLVGGQLTRRGTGYLSVSWDIDDNLWAAQGGQIVMFRGKQGTRQPLSQVVQVTVGPQVTGPFTAIRVAPDGVRVAIVMGGDELTFGAISQQTKSPQITFSLVQDSVSGSTNFTALTWYGPDDVIALAQPGSAVTEYPVSGAPATSIQVDPEMQTISASGNQPLIAALSTGHMVSNASITGSWMPVNNGDTPAAGISPIYPG